MVPICNPRVRNVNQYRTGRRASNCPSTGWARSGGSASLQAGGRGRSSRCAGLPCRAGRPQSAICFFVKACSHLNQPSRRRSRAIPAGGVCGTEVAFSLAQSGLFRSLERFCRRPVGLWGLDGPVAIRRRPPFAGVVRAVGPHPPGTPRSSVQQKCPPTSGSISGPAAGRRPAPDHRFGTVSGIAAPRLAYRDGV